MWVAIALVGVVVAIYAHLRISRFTRHLGMIFLARAALALVGAGLAYVMTPFDQQDHAWVWNFMAWFGLVHVPAAAILFLKGMNHSEPS
jgi:hypothetical protein